MENGPEPTEERPPHVRDLWIGAGLQLAPLPALLLPSMTAAAVLGAAIAGIGLRIWLRGCIRYATGKGWPPAVGLLGLFSYIGLLTIWQLPEMPRRRARRRFPLAPPAREFPGAPVPETPNPGAGTRPPLSRGAGDVGDPTPGEEG